mmetsp:Transcript_3081/g.6376  ORF Transcript_3081/g.6376 Transcript_3081/m.6376 type:complete len:210 (+) Transcript_3081:205-834(+)
MLKAHHLSRLFGKYTLAKTTQLIASNLEFLQEQQGSQLTEIYALLKARGFQVQERPLNPYLKLLKTQADFDLEVTFKALDPTKLHDNPYTKRVQIDNYNEFQVLVKRSSSPLQMVFDCSVYNSTLNINGMLVAKDFSKFNRDKLHVQKEIYKGPGFVDLKRPIQIEFLNFLASFGLDNQLAVCINELSSDKEMRLTAEWLIHLKEFLIA